MKPKYRNWEGTLSWMKNITSYEIGSDLITAVGSNHVRFEVGRGGGKRAFKIEMQTWGREGKMARGTKKSECDQRGS